MKKSLAKEIAERKEKEFLADGATPNGIWRIRRFRLSEGEDVRALEEIHNDVKKYKILQEKDHSNMRTGEVMVILRYIEYI